MEWIAKNRLVVGAFAAFAVVVAVGLLSRSGGSDDPEAEPTTESSSASTAAASPSIFGSNNDDRPEIGALDCFALMTDEAVEAALGIEDLPFEERGTIGQGEGEACAKRHRSSEFAFIQLEPGHPLDFDPTTELLGVTSEEVLGIGDGAVWFGGPDAEGGGTFGALAVRQETEKGWLHFHVVINRPDLEPDQVLETAKTFAVATLPRYPGVVAAAPEPTATPQPVEIRVEHEPIDRSSFSYVDNLLQKEADGEWTLGEGLVATLELVLGEAEPAEVLRHGEVGFTSATTIIAMARDYLDTVDDRDAHAEIETLLARLTPAPPPESSSTAASNLQRASHAISTSALQEPDDNYCWSPWLDSGVCWDEKPTGYAEDTVFSPIFTDDDRKGDTDVWEGWDVSNFEARATILPNLMFPAIAEMGGVKRKITYTPAPPYIADSYMFLTDAETCVVVIGRDVLNLGDTATARQLFDFQIAHCFVATNYPADGWGSGPWWRDALALYLSDVAQPNGSLEYVGPPQPLDLQLANEELSNEIINRSFTNMAFFEYIDETRGMSTVAEFVRDAIPGGGADTYPGIDTMIHGYAEKLGDGVIFDRGIDEDYDPPAEVWTDLTPRQIYLLEPDFFGMVRVHVIPPEGEYACLSYDFSEAPPRVSWRYGVPGSAGSWSGTMPTWINREATFLATSHTSGTWVAITVEDTGEDEDCEDDEDESSFSTIDFPLLCNFCDPSEYFYNWVFG